MVLGVSADDQASHQAFVSKNKLNFPLLVDTNLLITKAYDVDGGGYAKRVTYVLDGSGKIIIVDGNVNTSTQATDILARLWK